MEGGADEWTGDDFSQQRLIRGTCPCSCPGSTPTPPGLLGPTFLQGPPGATACWCRLGRARPCPKRLWPRPQGCPAAPPCGRFGDRRCPPPAWGASSPRFPGRRWTPCGPAPSVLAPCVFCSQAPKSYVSTLNPLQPDICPCPGPSGHQKTRPPLHLI